MLSSRTQKRATLPRKDATPVPPITRLTCLSPASRAQPLRAEPAARLARADIPCYPFVAAMTRCRRPLPRDLRESKMVSA